MGKLQLVSGTDAHSDPARRAADLFVAALNPHDALGPRAIRRILQARARRSQFFNARLFADPAWDMLLELYATELEQRRISVGDLCIAARVPATTALRWIAALERHGLIVKRCDPFDARRVHISLSTEGMTAISDYFSTMPVPPSL